MRILITGATGFIGRSLVQALLETTHAAKLLCVVRDKEQASRKLPFVEQVAFVEGLDKKAIANFSPEIVVHLAAFNTSDDTTDVIDNIIGSNITFGVKLLDILKDCQELKLFVNTGSFSQYVNGNTDAYLYSASKSAFDVFLKYYSTTYGVKSVTLVLYSVYGGDRTVKRLIDYVIESKGSPNPVEMTEGNQRLDFIHLSDVVSAYLAVMEHSDEIKSGSIYHIGTGIINSIREIVSIVETFTESNCNIKWGGRSYRRNDIMYAQAPKQIELCHFWIPKIKLAEGIKKMLEQY